MKKFPIFFLLTDYFCITVLVHYNKMSAVFKKQNAKSQFP